MHCRKAFHMTTIKSRLTPNLISFTRIGGPYNIPKGYYVFSKLKYSLEKSGIMNFADSYFNSSGSYTFDNLLEEDTCASLVEVKPLKACYFDASFIKIAEASGLTLLPQVAGPLFWLTVNNGELHQISGISSMTVASEPVGKRAPRPLGIISSSMNYLWRLGNNVGSRAKTLGLVDSATKIAGVQYWLFQTK
jgi:hypothetical protein